MSKKPGPAPAAAPAADAKALTNAYEEDVKTKYLQMIEEFKKHCNDMLDQTGKSLEAVIKEADANFVTIKDGFTKTFGVIKKQVLESNAKTVKSFTEGCNSLQQNIDANYNIAAKENMDLFSKNVANFREHCEGAVKKNEGFKKCCDFDTIIKDLTTKQTAKVTELEAKYKNLKTEIQANAADTAKKFTIEEKDLVSK